MLTNLHLKLNQTLYLKDPESSQLGMKIISGSIDLIDEIGFDHFTFRKLGSRIGSNEASIYRYFENKYKLLLYLISWYWGWMSYRLSFATANIESPAERLTRALQLLTKPVEEDGDFVHIDEVRLNRILIAESSKAYLVKEVDAINEEGAFSPYKLLVQQVSDIVLEINPDYKYPHMLISTVIEGAHHQHYFALHLPRLTDIIKGEDAITAFYTSMVFKSIES
ncbi:MAG: TetR/AcrR family transcriptional regulator [Owenweeksia sp.]